MGQIAIDDGAVKALGTGKSLLPAGVTDVKGEFLRGDAVVICDPRGREIGQGISGYTSAEARALIGLRSSQIEKVLGYPGRAALVHRNDMAT